MIVRMEILWMLKTFHLAMMNLFRKSSNER